MANDDKVMSNQMFFIDKVIDRIHVRASLSNVAKCMINAKSGDNDFANCDFVQEEGTATTCGKAPASVFICNQEYDFRASPPVPPCKTEQNYIGTCQSTPIGNWKSLLPEKLWWLYCAVRLRFFFMWGKFDRKKRRVCL